MKTKKLLWLLLILATMAAAFAFTVSATDNASEPTLKIEGGNLSFEDSVFILYAVSHEGIVAEDVRLYFWNEPQSGENAYAYDTADYSFAPYQENVTVAGKSCVTFRNNTLRAKNMTDYVYARAYAEVDGVGYYSEVSKYSILQYAYNQLGKTAAGTNKQSLKDMLSAMLEYGAMAQIHFSHKTDRLANADYYQIKVEGGTLADGFNKGLYLSGEKVVISAPETDGELVFAEWVNSAGESISKDREYEITVGETNETYTAVYIEEVRYSEGLKFLSNSDGTCSVYSIGTCTDTEIRIPPTSPEGKKVTKIYSRAFANNTAITYVSIPSTVQVIGDNAFEYCPELLVVSFEEGSELSEIGSSAFCYCSKLIAVSLPEGVTTIKSSAFNRCTSLSIFSIPSTVTSIGHSAFYNCEKLVSLAIPESITSISDSTFYNCKALKTVTCSPSLVSIGKSAFAGCENLMRFDIPSTVTYIGNHAFSKCKSIPSIVLPEGLITLDSYAFLSCTSLSEIVIPEGITHLDDGVFSNCTGLVSITIPKSLATVDPNAFQSCTSLKNVYISDLAAWCNISFYDYFTHPLYLGGSLYLNNALITDLVIPEGVERIGLYAFYKQNSITSVTFPTSLTFVGNSAFAGCKNLQEIHISDLAAWCKIAFDGSWNHPLEYAGALYLNGELITDLVIPEGITAIPANAFTCCSNIKSVTIPASITEIGYNAFVNCTGLSKVYYGGTESEWNQLIIGSNCEYLTRASRYYYSVNQPTTTGNFWHYVDGEIVVWPEYIAPVYSQGLEFTSNGNGTCYVSGIGACTDTELNIPPFSPAGDTVTGIGSNAFKNCTALTSVVIPDSVESIRGGSFSGCSSLKDITIPFVGESRKTANDTYQFPLGHIFGTARYTGGVATIQRYYASYQNSPSYSTYYIPATLKSVTVTGGNILYGAFYGCSSLTNIAIPDSITSIGTAAFYGCSSLKNIVIPYSVVSISDFAFYDCHSLASVVIPNFVTIINEYAFEHCTSLTNVVIGNSVTSIGSFAFRECTSVTNIVIPDSVTSIGSSAFSGCISLISVVIGDSVTSIENSVFDKCTSLKSITVDDGNEMYKSIDGNLYTKDQKTLIRYAIGKAELHLMIPNFVTMIGEHAFYGCTSLMSIVIPDSVTDIGDYAFGLCTSLSRLAIPDSVISISDDAFFYCTSLTSVVIGDSVTSIGNYAFEGCSALTSVYYKGDADSWNAISIGSYDNSYLTDATRYFFSEEAPTEAGNYWHYDADGKVTAW